VGLIFPPSLLATAAVGAGIGTGSGAVIDRVARRKVKEEVEWAVAVGGSGIVVIFDEQWMNEMEKSLTRADRIARDHLHGDDDAGTAEGAFHSRPLNSRLYMQTSPLKESLRRVVNLCDRQTGHSFALPERAQHGDQHGVEAVGAFDVPRGHDMVKCLRGQENRTVLPAAQASVSTDQGFERRDVEGDAFHAAVEIEIGRLRHQDSAPEHPGRVVAVRLQRVLSG
jgi:hypothetical protein